MTSVDLSRSARVRSHLSHPVVDCDGHWMEPFPVLLDYVEKVGGSKAASDLISLEARSDNDWYHTEAEERIAKRRRRAPWWGYPANTLDRATGMLPDLLYRRLDEFGIDFGIILPTRNTPGSQIEDSALRRVVVRATNIMHSELFSEYSERMIPAACIPTNTPEEGIEEAEYAVQQLGLRVAVISGSVRRPIGDMPKTSAQDPSLAPYYIDNLALDSPYDYDPLWAKFVELQLSPMTHAGSQGWVDRSSPTNFVFNHVGHFAQAGQAFARALVLGGVPKRFPNLRFAFLEGGVGWARILCSDLVGHWEKRNATAMQRNLQPSNLDIAELRALIRRHGGAHMQDRADDLLGSLDVLMPYVGIEELTSREGDLDDFVAAAVEDAGNIEDIFAQNFYFGCESDDPMTALAFDSRFRPRLRPLFSSDVSHYDVTDMTEVLEEAYELVEHGLIDELEFREFTFSNTVRLHGLANPDFFRGTAVETAAKVELSQ